MEQRSLAITAFKVFHFLASIQHEGLFATVFCLRPLSVNTHEPLRHFGALCKKPYLDQKSPLSAILCALGVGRRLVKIECLAIAHFGRRVSCPIVLPALPSTLDPQSPPSPLKRRLPFSGGTSNGVCVGNPALPSLCLCSNAGDGFKSFLLKPGWLNLG